MKYYHYVCDEQGSVSHIIRGEDKENGAAVQDRVLNHYEYDAFGNTISCEERVAKRFRYQSGSTTGKPNQVHHFATNKSKKYTSQFENITKKYGLDLDDDWNKELMPHQGRHPYAYHDYVLDNIQKFDRIANGNKTKFLKLYDQMKRKIINNPGMLYKDYWKK